MQIWKFLRMHYKEKEREEAAETFCLSATGRRPKIIDGLTFPHCQARANHPFEANASVISAVCL